MKQRLAILGLSLSGLSGAIASGGTIFAGAYPNLVLVIDEAQGKVTDRIPLATGLPRGLRLSYDRKSIIVSTNDHNGFEVLDLATHKITSHFVLDDATHRYRINGGAPDPQGKLLYASATEITKQVDRYEIGKEAAEIFPHVDRFGVVIAPDGTRAVRNNAEGAVGDAETIGRHVGRALLKAGAGEILEQVYGAPGRDAAV